MNESLGYLQTLATEVYPLILKDLGLVEALDWESNKLSEKTGVHVLFTSEVEHLELDQRITNTLFRTYQEKIIKLSVTGAKEIVSTLSTDDNYIVLTIYVDAINDPYPKLIEDIAIEERLRSIKGEYKLSTSPEEGNKFTISVPYISEKNSNQIT